MKKKSAAEGEARGEAKGERKVLVRLAEKKYGALPEWALARFESADDERLLLWAERVLSAKTLQEVFE